MAISNQKHSTIFGKEYTPPSDLFDDAYIENISKYKDKSWYNRLLENPFLASKQSDYSPDFWSQFSENWMNDFSARDSYYANLINQREQWLSERVAQMEQQDYDSPIQQVQREQSAGLNPDLNGSITPGASAENDQPFKDLPMNQNGTAPNLLSVGNSIITTAFGFIDMFQNMRGKSIDNRLKSMGLFENQKESAWDAISESVGEVVNSLGDASPNMANLFDKESGKFVPGFSKALMDRIDRLPISRSNRKSIRGIVNDLVYSTDAHGLSEPSMRFQTLFNDVASNLSKSRNEYAKNYALPGGNEEDMTALRFISKEIYKPINDLSTQVDSLVLQNKRSYEKTSRDLGVPGLKARADYSGYRLQGDILQVKTKITSAFKKINQKITGSSDLSPAWKLALEAGVASTEAFVLSKLQIR